MIVFRTTGRSSLRHEAVLFLTTESGALVARLSRAHDARWISTAKRTLVERLTSTLTRISHQLSSRDRRGAAPSGVFDPRGAERVLAVRYGAPPALVSHRHQRVSDGLAWGRALGHSALLSAGRAPRGEKTPLGVVHRRSQQEAGEICGLKTAKAYTGPTTGRVRTSRRVSSRVAAGSWRDVRA